MSTDPVTRIRRAFDVLWNGKQPKLDPEHVWCACGAPLVTCVCGVGDRFGAFARSRQIDLTQKPPPPMNRHERRKNAALSRRARAR